MKLDRTLWLTADRDKVVEDGDPKAAFLLGTAGKDVPDDEAKRLGITEKKAPAAKQTPAPANKARSAPANKGK